jgi:transposase-like protein
MAGISGEVKAEILAKVKAGQKVVELSKQYGISDKTIYNWLRGQVTEQVHYREYKRVLKENEDLKNILGVVTLELEKSKKRRSKIVEQVFEKFPNTNKNTLAKSFKIARRSLYQENKLQQNKDTLLKEQIESVLASQPSYDYRRVAIELNIGKK